MLAGRQLLMHRLKQTNTLNGYTRAPHISSRPLNIQTQDPGRYDERTEIELVNALLEDSFLIEGAVVNARTALVRYQVSTAIHDTAFAIMILQRMKHPLLGQRIGNAGMLRQVTERAVSRASDVQRRIIRLEVAGRFDKVIGKRKYCSAVSRMDGAGLGITMLNETLKAARARMVMPIKAVLTAATEEDVCVVIEAQKE